MDDGFTQHLLQARAWLVRAANARLRNPDWAADAVSETLLAAMEQRPAFDEPQRLRRWLLGVLRHKVVDQMRHEGPDRRVHAGGDTDSPAHEPPAPESDGPEAALQRQRVLAALQRALTRLPPAHARAFELRYAHELDTDELCRELGVTPGHLAVMLYRARAALRPAMSAWQGPPAPSPARPGGPARRSGAHWRP